MFYLCAIGSSYFPHQHIPQTMLELAIYFKTVHISSVIETKAEHIQTACPFFNAMFIIYSHLNSVTLKQLFNRLEHQHHRNRCNPNSKQQNRTLDLDIIARRAQAKWSGCCVQEAYLQVIYQELTSPFYQYKPAHRVNMTLISGLKFGQRPATIHFNQNTREINIIKQKLHRLPYRH